MNRKLANPYNLNWFSKSCPDIGFYSAKNRYCSHFDAHSAKIQTRRQRAVRATVPFSIGSHRIFSINEHQFNGLRGFATFRPPGERQIRYASSRNVAKAQAALLDYLHSTRGIYFTDAEQISKNCPIFVCRILEKLEDVEDIERELVRFLRYHPINEFEPFFESIGLKPSEYKPLLPRELMFLSDVRELLKNYHDLCDYGIGLNKIGKLYIDAKEMFLYGPGLLKSKLLAYEQLGLSRSTVIKLIVSTPSLLLGDGVDEEFVQLLNRLEVIGFPRDWIGGPFSEKNACNWDKMSLLLHFFRDMGFDEKSLMTLISKHPSFLLDCSGNTVFSLISLLLKMGATKEEIIITLTEFPHPQVGIFKRNLWRAFQFLVEIEMDYEDVKKLIRHHKDTLGQILLKRPTSILTNLSTGKRRLCKVIIEDPHLLQKFAMGLKVPPLPTGLNSIMEKKKFLSRLGFVEGSNEMKEAFEVFRGKGDELQNRFNFFVKRGLEQTVVLEMLKRAPHILNQKIEVLDEKLSFIVNSLGYPLSSVARLPQCMSSTTHRIKLRHLMYDWLKERGKAKHKLALGTIVSCSDKMFIKRFVNLHPEGSDETSKKSKVFWMLLSSSSSSSSI